MLQSLLSKIAQHGHINISRNINNIARPNYKAIIVNSTTCQRRQQFTTKLTPEQEELEHHQVIVDQDTKLVTFGVKETRAKHTATVIFLHGLGDTSFGWAEGMWAVGSYEKLDHVKFIMPTAPVMPVTINNNMPCPAWYDITGLESRANETCEGLDESYDRIIKMCQEEIDFEGIPSDRIVLAGFSQGGAVSLFSGLSGNFQPAGIICMSGYMPRAESFSDWKNESIKMDVPIRLFHGEQDQVVKVEWARKSGKVIKDTGFNNISMSAYPAMQHNASEEELKDVAKELVSMIPEDYEI